MKRNLKQRRQKDAQSIYKRILKRWEMLCERASEGLKRNLKQRRQKDAQSIYKRILKRWEMLCERASEGLKRNLKWEVKTWRR